LAALEKTTKRPSEVITGAMESAFPPEAADANAFLGHSVCTPAFA
jgi:hypothetical protein